MVGAVVDHDGAAAADDDVSAGGRGLTVVLVLGLMMELVMGMIDISEGIDTVSVW